MERARGVDAAPGFLRGTSGIASPAVTPTLACQPPEPTAKVAYAGIRV